MRKNSMKLVRMIPGAVLAIAAGLGPVVASAADAAPVDDVTLLRNTVANLLEAMVKQGLLSKDAATRLVADAQAKAEAETATTTAEGQAAPGDVRVTYVPQVVRDEITQEVTASVSQTVVADVKNAARTEGWGVPAALPDWVRRMTWEGEVRARAVGIFYDDGNATTIPNFQVINQNGGIGGLGQEALLNTTKDETILQVRLLLGATYEMAPNLLGAFSIQTGNQINPLTRNQDLGLYGRSSALLLDEAYLSYRLPRGDDEKHHFQVLAGRFANPFQTTELLWDNDLRFGGAVLRYASNAPTYRDWHSLDNYVRPWEEIIGPEGRGVFANVGAFQVQTEPFTSSDKWLYVAQAGYEHAFSETVRGSIAAGWWQWENVAGRLNPPGSTQFDYTAPDFLTKGNTLFDISNDDDPLTQRWALAAEYQVLQINSSLTWLVNDTLQTSIVAEWAKNLGYDQNEVLTRIGTANANLVPDRERSTAYRVEWRIGWPRVVTPLSWRVTAGYTYTERDALLDSFVDGNTRRGGTDAEGFILAGELGVANNSWLRVRYFSADEIDGPPLGIDVLQLDWFGQF
jgi:polyhydroxyalkanoate synthesis regulator phasin